MPKIRALKPSFFTDDRIVELSPLARLLYQGMWIYACDNGHLEDRPRQLKLRILPADDCDISELIAEVEAQGLIIRADGWITIPTIGEHQKPDKRYFLTCDHPGCSDDKPTLSTRRKPPVRTKDAPPEPAEGTPASQRVHTVATTSSHRGPSGATDFPSTDGDGDGDGDGDTALRAGTSLAPLAAPQNAGTLVGEWLESTHPRPPVKVIGQLSREIKQLLDEGQPYDDVRNGVIAWAQKALHPATLASVVHETRTARAPRVKSSGVDWDAALQRAAAKDRSPS